MATGLYQDTYTVERFLGSVSASTISQRFVVPFDADVLGMILFVSTAPGTNNGVVVNVNNTSTSQQGGSGTPVTAYNLWTATNVPSILGTATTNVVASQPTIIKNVPYALNYPLPGPSGTTGYNTAQSTSQSTENPVVAPPTQYAYTVTGGLAGQGLLPPDNTYTDYNGVTLSPASYLHAGDVLSFVITAGGSGASVGSAANLNCELIISKR